jgi:hypothetical protein
VPIVYDLADLYGRMRRDVALHIIPLRSEAAVRRPSYRPVNWPDERIGARQAATPAPRRLGAGQFGRGDAARDETMFGRRQRNT